MCIPSYRIIISLKIKTIKQDIKAKFNIIFENSPKFNSCDNFKTLFIEQCCHFANFFLINFKRHVITLDVNHFRIRYKSLSRTRGAMWSSSRNHPNKPRFNWRPLIVNYQRYPLAETWHKELTAIYTGRADPASANVTPIVRKARTSVYNVITPQGRCAYVIPYGCLLLLLLLLFLQAAREKRPEIRGLHYLLDVSPTRIHTPKERTREKEKEKKSTQATA